MEKNPDLKKKVTVLKNYQEILIPHNQQCKLTPFVGPYTLIILVLQTGSASEWSLYISEWDAPGGGLPLSNIRVTTKVSELLSGATLDIMKDLGFLS